MLSSNAFKLNLVTDKKLVSVEDAYMISNCFVLEGHFTCMFESLGVKLTF